MDKIDIKKLNIDNRDKERSLEDMKNIGLKVLYFDDERNKNIERKSEVLLGFLGLIIPIIIALYFNIIDKIPSLSSSNFNIIFLVVIFIMIISVFFSLMVLITRSFRQIDLNNIWKVELEKKISKTNVIKINLIEHFLVIHNHNKRIIDNKSFFLKISFLSTFSAVILIVVFFRLFIIKV